MMHLQGPAFFFTVILIKPVKYVNMGEPIEPQQSIPIFFKNFDPGFSVSFANDTDGIEIVRFFHGCLSVDRFQVQRSRLKGQVKNDNRILCNRNFIIKMVLLKFSGQSDVTLRMIIVEQCGLKNTLVNRDF